ncbi:MAG: hypothetical protein A4E53_02544 [Pelotomaculum sp. PtaB.Bin104]|nr:MAG: hypothetical protein A4E53_02544 [Pelotomaculum sp. PtaB.Bin104]OPY61734.1 MAG: hypothetical protein A4E56_01853 [Pelotomaculum sp. PtaU1.Bin065]
MPLMWILWTARLTAISKGNCRPQWSGLMTVQLPDRPDHKAHNRLDNAIALPTCPHPLQRRLKNDDDKEYEVYNKSVRGI